MRTRVLEAFLWEECVHQLIHRLGGQQLRQPRRPAVGLKRPVAAAAAGPALLVGARAAMREVAVAPLLLPLGSRSAAVLLLLLLCLCFGLLLLFLGWRGCCCPHGCRR
jgi:hypothetical protein